MAGVSLGGSSSAHHSGSSRRPALPTEIRTSFPSDLDERA